MSDHEPEDVYNMDETGLCFRAHPNKTLARGKVKSRKLQTKCVTLALVVNSIGTDKLKLLVIHRCGKPSPMVDPLKLGLLSIFACLVLGM